MARRKATPEEIPPPSPEYVKGLESTQRDIYAERNRIMEEVYRLRFREHSLLIPDVYRSTTREIRVPVVDDMLTRVTNDLTASPPEIVVPPLRVSDTAQRNSTKLEKYLNGSWAILDIQNEPQRNWRSFVDALAMFGMGVSKLVHYPPAWAGYYEAVDKRRPAGEDPVDYEDRLLAAQLEATPFFWTVPDPRTIYPVYNGGRLTEILEVGRRQRNYVADRYADVLSMKDGKLENPLGIAYVDESDGDGRTCKWVEHWDAHWCSYWADGQLVRRFRHNYGRPPYFLAYGLTTASNKPEHAMRSVAARLVGLVETLDQLLTMYLHWAHTGAYPMGVVRRDAEAMIPYGQDGEAGDPILYTPGEFQELNAGEAIEWVQPPPVGRDLKELVEILTSMTQQYGIPDAGRGVMSSDQAGYAINQMLTQIKGIYGPIAQNAAICFEQMSKFKLFLIKHVIGESVPIWADTYDARSRRETRAVISVGPADIKHYNVLCRIHPDLHQNQIAIAEAGLRQLQAGAISRRYHQENNLGIANPDEMEDEILFEAIFNSPEVMKWRVEELMREAGLVERMKQDQAGALQKMLPPQGGQPIDPQQAAMLGATLGGETGGAGDAIQGGPPGPAQPGIGTPGVPMMGGRGAGVEIQPNTQMAPGGIPGMGEPQAGGPL